jgi:hypothetical protein
MSRTLAPAPTMRTGAGDRRDSSGREPGVAKAGEGLEAKEAEVVAARGNVVERSFVASV